MYTTTTTTATTNTTTTAIKQLLSNTQNGIENRILHAVLYVEIKQWPYEWMLANIKSITLTQFESKHKVAFCDIIKSHGLSVYTHAQQSG